MIFEPKTLIVVYKEKNELILNQLKKLIETKDDSCEDGIVGVTDGSVRIVAWTEKVWKDQKSAGKTGDLNSKILFIGNIKDTDKLKPIIDIKYDQYGIKYGWAGNQAIIYVDYKALEKADYPEFFDEFCELPIPEGMKVRAITPSIFSYNSMTNAERQQAKKRAAIKLGGIFLNPFGGVIGADVAVSEDIKKKVQLQQFIFGIHQLYTNDLEEFLK